MLCLLWHPPHAPLPPHPPPVPCPPLPAQAKVEDLVASCPPNRPVYLLGESFGGVLALALAAQVGPDPWTLTTPQTLCPDPPVSPLP